MSMLHKIKGHPEGMYRVVLGRTGFSSTFGSVSKNTIVLLHVRLMQQIAKTIHKYFNKKVISLEAHLCMNFVGLRTISARCPIVVMGLYCYIILG